MFTLTDAAVRGPRLGLGRRLLTSSLVDSLVGPHGIDSYLELVRSDWSVHDARARVASVHRATERSVTLTLRPNANWQSFDAGQFVPVTVEIDGVRHTRCYSPASSEARRGQLEFSITAHPDGLVSRFLRERAHPGMTVQLGVPDGDFVLPPDRPNRLLLISAGSGITPVMSILRTLCDDGHPGRVGFLHYARGRQDIIYGDELAELSARHANVRVECVHTRTGSGSGLNGHLTADHLREVEPDFARTPTYVCGPAALVDAVRHTFDEIGAGALVRSESFVPPPPAIRSDAAEGLIRFERSGLTAANTGASLLDQAEAAGLAPEHGCRMGICHTCTCRKAAGTVRNLLTGELSDEGAEDIQICISAPVGDLALDI